MTKNPSKLPVWIVTSAWREILTRIFEGIEPELNVTPEWLVNPATNRRLKLDMLYPQLGVAVRIEGLQGKQRRQRPSLEEEEQKRIRDDARLEVCRAHGIELILINIHDDNLQRAFREIDLSLSRASVHVTDNDLVRKISQARATAASLARRISQPSQLKLYADLWEDRQYQVPEPTRVPVTLQNVPSFTIGMEVQHTTFGPGVVSAITPSQDDLLLTVDFVTAGQKTLLASLVAGKLRPG